MDINIKVNKATRDAIPDKNKIGVEGENLQEKLVFYFEDEFVDGVARLEYEQDGVKNYIPLTKIDQTYVVPIKNVITKPWKLNLELVITEPQQTEGIPLFKSEIFEVYITNAINAVNEAPEGYDLWIDIANAKIIEIDEKLEDVDDAIEHINDAIQETENLDLDVSDKVDGDVTVTLTKKDASTKTVTLSDGTSLMFNWDGTKLGIKTDEDEEYTYVDLQGIQGPIGPQGEAFQIKKTYSSVAEMNADFDNMQLGDYVMIASTVETEDNAKLYTRGAEQWIFISDFSGATGIQGPTGLTPNIQIGTVVSGSSPSVTRTGTNENPILNFTLVKGETGNTGPTGPTGNGISSISKTSTSGLIDTYTITYTNATTSTFTVTNGNGIVSIVKTSTSGLVDTYTITYTNGNTTTFDVTNGEDGEVTQEQLDETNAEVERAIMVYNALPKVEDEGTEITLNGTANCPMKLELNPSELTQETTTGANIQKFHARTSSSSGAVYTCDDKGQITVTGTATTTVGYGYNLPSSNPITLEAGTYTVKIIGTMSSDNTVYREGYIYLTFDNNNEATFTLTSRTTTFYIGVYVNPGVHNDNFYITLTKGTVATTERYTGGIPQPNPEFPSEVQVIKGNNSINIWNKNLATLNTGAYSSYRIINPIKVNATEKMTCIVNFSTSTSGVVRVVLYSDESMTTQIQEYTSFSKDTDGIITITANQDGYLGLAVGYTKDNFTFNKLFVAQGEYQLSDYEPRQEQVLPLNLPVENLFNKNSFNELNAYPTSSKISAAAATRTLYIPIKGGQTYTVSKTQSARFAVATTVNTPAVDVSVIDYQEQNSATNITIQTSSNVNYLCVFYFNSSYDTTITKQQILDTIQIELSDKANRYTPYGTTPIEYCKIGTYEDEFEHDGDKWYLNKYVGKVVLDGTYNDSAYGSDPKQSGLEYYSFNVDITYAGYTRAVNSSVCMCDKLKYSTSSIFTNDIQGIKPTSAGTFKIKVFDSSLTTVALFKTWLEENKPIVYYQLSTPTHDEITDATLISQLNAIEQAVSYDKQTNISQTNAELPFRIKVSAVRSLANIFDLINE